MKKIFLITLILILFFTCASVCASDMNETVVASEIQSDGLNEINNHNEEISVANNTGEVLTVDKISDKLNYALDDGSFKDLKDDISNAQGELNLSRDYVFDDSIDSANAIVIDKPIVINGNNHNILAESKTTVFSITASNVVLKNINFYDSSGKCIYWQASNGTLINCKFEDCKNSGYGGAIHWRIDKNGLISNCTFKRCQSPSYCGGALYLENTNVKIENSEFIDNSASMNHNGGGAIYLDGGGITINNCTFNHNTAKRGGAISGSSKQACSINNSKFYNNSNMAIYWSGNNFEINNSIFIDNSNIVRKIFEPYSPINSAGTLNACGGAVCIYGNNTKILNSIFKNNKISATIRSNVDKYKDPTFNQWNYYNIRETFHINTYGGAIYVNGNKFYLNNITCEDNLAYSSGIVNIQYSSITYDMSGINMYQYIYAKSYGGAIYLNGGGILSNSYISGNNLDGHAEVNRGIVPASTCPTICDVKGYGVGVYWDGYSRNNLVNNSVFIQNNLSSGQTGSALYLNNFNGDVNYNIFLQNPDKVIDSSASEISADYNWWGNTVSNFNQKLFTDDIGISKWLFLNMSSNNSNLQIGDKAIVTLDLSNVYDSSSNNIGHVYEINNIDFALESNKIKTNVSNAIINNGVAYIEITAQTYGQGSLTASYNGIRSTLPFGISKKTSQVKSQITNCSIYKDELIAHLNVTHNATGILKVYLNNNLYSSITLKGNNALDINLTGLNANNYTLYVEYGGDNTYAGSSDTIKFEIKKANNAIQISDPYTIDYGDVITLNLDKGNVTDGTLQVQIKNNKDTIIYNYTYNIMDISNITLPMLNAGDYNLFITYESNNYYGSSFDSNFTVNKLNPNINKQIISTVYGKSEILFTSSVDGVLKINILNNTYKTFHIESNKNNYLNISDLDAGDYEVKYVFIPDTENYYNTTITDTLTIFKSEPTFDIDINDINYKQSANLNINYLNDISGFANITISNDEGFEIKFTNVALSGGKFNQILNNLNASEYTVTLVYSGDNNYYPTTQNTTFNVFKIDPIMEVDVTDAVYGQTAKIVANCNAEGNITITIVSVRTYDNLIIKDQRVVQNINDIDAGTYDVKVKYNGNDNYNTKTVDAILTITKVSTNVVASVDDITYSEPVVINVKGSVDGVATVKIDNNYVKEVNAIANTVVPVTFYDKIPAGKHNVSVILHPSDKNYGNSFFNTNFTVAKKQTSITLGVDDSVYGEDVIVNVTASADGKVVITVGDITREKNVLANTLTKINLGVLAADSYDVEVSFDAGENYKPSSNNGNIVISPAKAEILTIEAQNNVYGENTIIKVKTNVGGNLTVKAGSAIKSVNVVANKLTSFDFGILDAKTYDIEVSLNAGNNYTKPLNRTQITVSPKQTTVNVNAKNSIYGENVIVNVSASENGKITVQVGTIIKDVNVEVNKLYSVDFGILDAKSYAVNVTFNGGNNYEESYDDASLIVSQAQAKITEIQALNKIYGENVTVNVKTNVDGFLTVKVGNTTKVEDVIVNQLTSINFGVLDADSYDVTLTLNAGSNYISDNNSTKITVSPKVVSLDLGVANSIYGDNVIVNVTSSYGGEVILKVGDITKHVDVNANKVTSVNLGVLNATVYDCELNMDLNDNFIVNNCTSSVTIIPKVVSLDLDVVNSIYGDNVIVNVTASENGRITVKLNDIDKYLDVEANKVYSVDFGILDVNNYKINAIFDAGNNYVSSPKVAYIKVTPKQTDLTLNVKEYESTENVVVNVTASENGKITIKCDSIVKTIDVTANNITSVDLGILPIGSYEILANFTAGVNYIGSSDSATFKVLSKLNDEDISISVPDIKANQANNIEIKLPGDATGTVTLTIGNDTYSFDVKNGVANVKVPQLAEGNYNYTITYSGDNKYSSFTKTNSISVTKIIPTTLTSSAVTTVYNGGKYLVATLKDNNGKPISGVKVTINLNGVKTLTTDSNGQVKLTTNNLAPNSYTATITFAGNTNHAKSSINVKVTVNKATPKLTAKAKTFKKSVKTKKYSITLKTNKNKPMKKVKVIIKINKKTYTAKTNSKGKATFKIKKLTKKGAFTATVTYKGDKYYKKVTKKVKIKIK